MKAEKAKLKRLNRLEKLRSVAKQQALTEAAKAERVYAQTQALAQRTSELVEAYRARDDAQLGGDLCRMKRFASSLQGIANVTAADAARAADTANLRQAELAAAERRRAVVEERATATARLIAAKGSYAPHSARTAPRADSEDA
jgi:hypothetical protein